MPAREGDCMARRTTRPRPAHELRLRTVTRACPECGGPLLAAYMNRRIVSTLAGFVRLRAQVRRCGDRGCRRFHVPLRAEREGAIALPDHEFGLDVIALVGALRRIEGLSLPAIHAELLRRGLPICLRSVGNLLDRHDELPSSPTWDVGRLQRLTAAEGRVLLAVDDQRPDVGTEVLWVLRDCLGGAALLA